MNAPVTATQNAVSSTWVRGSLNKNSLIHTCIHVHAPINTHKAPSSLFGILAIGYSLLTLVNYPSQYDALT